MADETTRDEELRGVEDDAAAARDEYDTWAEDQGLPTNEEIDEARAAGRQSGLIFGTTGTSMADVPVTVADRSTVNEAVNEAQLEQKGDAPGALTVDAQPGEVTNAGEVPQERTEDGVPAEESAEQTGVAADAEEQEEAEEGAEATADTATEPTARKPHGPGVDPNSYGTG